MDRRTLIAVSLCFLIFMAWQKLYIEPRTIPQQAAPSAQTAQERVAPQTSTAATAPVSESAAITIPSRTIPVASSTGDAVVGDGGRFFAGWNLKSYKLDISADAASVDIASVTHENGNVELAFDDPSFAYLSKVRGSLEKTASGVRWIHEDSAVRLVREFDSLPGDAWVPVRVKAEFKDKRPSYAFLSIVAQNPSGDPESHDRQLLYWTNKGIERVSIDNVSQTSIPTPVDYIGATNRYFALALINQGGEPKGLVQPLGATGGRVSLVYPVTGSALEIGAKVYFGPKELDLLRSVDPRLDHAVDLGWFTFFAYPLLKLLKWFYGFVGNYGVAIIILTLLLKVVTYPLTYKSMKSMKEMAKIQPQLQRLREKHKDDREALNREMMTMMKSHGYNPMAGCLPILVQMPVFIALYRVLYSSIELFHAPFFLWIHDLSARDPYYVTPVLMTATMFIQQKLTPTAATDPTQQKMMQLMPVIFGAFMLTLPSGLTVYMLVNALASIAQQLLLNKKLGITPNAPAATAAAR